ncbi:MAG: ATP-binding cassette domain-containing protein [Sandaracinaceae bacterium]|nr:ATP-binding cassette domain-containing protein [Sandaracinaceae bacterium]
MKNDSTLLASATHLEKSFRNGKLEVKALRGVDLDVHAGDFLALVGPSGSGKTTLLNLLGALDRPTSGEVEVLGQRLSTLGKGQRAQLRLRSIGFVFQAYNLVPVLTAAENVELVLELQGVGAKERRARALGVLSDLGLGELAHRRPNEMSGGSSSGWRWRARSRRGRSSSWPTSRARTSTEGAPSSSWP